VRPHAAPPRMRPRPTTLCQWLFPPPSPVRPAERCLCQAAQLRRPRPPPAWLPHLSPALLCARSPAPRRRCAPRRAPRGRMLRHRARGHAPSHRANGCARRPPLCSRRLGACALPHNGGGRAPRTHGTRTCRPHFCALVGQPVGASAALVAAPASPVLLASFAVFSTAASGGGVSCGGGVWALSRPTRECCSMWGGGLCSH